MKVVLDTNVLVSGIARGGGPPGRVVEAWRAGRFELVVAEEQLLEARRVFAYPKVRRLLKAGGITEPMIDEFFEILRFKSHSVATEGIVLPVSPADPGDIHVLQAFVASRADYLVTGDKRDLLSLGLSGVIAVAEFDRRLTALGFR